MSDSLVLANYIRSLERRIAALERKEGGGGGGGGGGSMTGAQILAALAPVDGSGSGLDADLLDGLSSASFAAASHAHSGADITTGTVADARIDAALTRDTEVMPIVLANDGSGSLLDADKLDGLDSTAFALSGHTHPAGGNADTLDGLDSTAFAQLTGAAFTGNVSLPNVYVERSGNIAYTSAGWKRIGMFNAGGAGRGYARVAVMGTGSSNHYTMRLVIEAVSVQGGGANNGSLVIYGGTSLLDTLAVDGVRLVETGGNIYLEMSVIQRGVNSPILILQHDPPLTGFAPYDFDLYTTEVNAATPTTIMQEVVLWGGAGMYTSGNVTAKRQFLGSNGAAATPVFAFANDPDSGLYSIAANIPGMAAGGVGNIQNWQPTQMGGTVPFHWVDGTQALPIYAFNAENGMGMYRDTTAGSALAFSTAGAKRFEIGTGGTVTQGKGYFAGYLGKMQPTALTAIASMGTLSLGGVYGSFVITCHTAPDYGVLAFLALAAAAPTVTFLGKVGDHGWSNLKDTAPQTNIYFSSGNLTIQNTHATTQHYSVMVIAGYNSP
jgi:hypothetical protein